MDKNTQISSVPAPVGEFQGVGKPITYQDVINCPSVKLRVFSAKHGEGALKAILAGVLTDISNLLSFEVKNEMIVAAAELIISDYPDTKLADFKLFQSDVLRGKVGGKLFRWDTRTILEAWAEYYALREAAFAQEREAKHQAEKKAYNDAYDRIPTNRDMKKEYEILKRQAETDAKKQRYRLMSLKDICQAEGVDYETLVMACETDCRSIWTDDSVISFEDYLKLHLVRVANEVRRNPDILGEYTI